MMRLPPGEPSTASTSSLPSNTIVGAMVLRGRFPGSTRLAIGAPCLVNRREREVGQLVVEQEARRQTPEPNAPSMVVVIDTALPSSSITEIWLVPARSSVASMPKARRCTLGGSPAVGLAIA